MSIESTQYLSKISSEKLKQAYSKWPNPLMPLACMLGGLLCLMIVLVNHNPEDPNVGQLIGASVVFVVLTVGSSMFGLVKVAKARKLLDSYAEEHSVPKKELLKEFKKNLKHLKKL